MYVTRKNNKGVEKIITPPDLSLLEKKPLSEEDQIKKEIAIRIELFLNGKINLKQLHPIDLIYLKPSQLGITGRLYNNLRLYFYVLSTKYDVFNKEIGQLHSEIKEKRKEKQL